MATPSKSILVSLRENRRVVKFLSSSCEKEAAMSAVRTTFSDVHPEQDFFLQIKDDEWRGAFVDLLDDREIVDKSIVEAILKPLDMKSEVGIY